MNKIYITIVYVATLLLFFGCSDDFLVRTPLDELNNEIYWVTEADCKSYNNKVYDILKDDTNYQFMLGMDRGAGMSYTGGLWWMDLYSDNCAPRHSRAERFFKVRTGYHTTQAGYREGDYTGWALIRTINFGLENLPRAVENVDEETIKKYEAELRLFRAWFYADKVRKFGDVQWIDKTLNTDSPELYGERDSREFVMEKVLEDLNFACKNLPEPGWGSSGTPGRIHKWAALAVKSRVCLFEGTFRKYHGLSGADGFLQACESASKEIIDGGNYQIYNTGDVENDYNYWHRQTNLNDNPEAIYFRKYVAGVNGHYTSRYFFNHYGGATRSFVYDFLCTDGKPITTSELYAGDDSIETVFINRDPRLRQCILHPEDKEKYNYNRDNNTYPRISSMGGEWTYTGFHAVKIYNAEDEGQSRYNMEQEVACLRLGEVLLNYAEAKAELGTITQDDLDMSINVLRDRVAMPHLTTNPEMDPKYANDGVSALIVEIRRERRVELFLEGHRYFDLLRWKQGKYLAMKDYGMRYDANAELRYAPKTAPLTEEIDGVPYIDVRAGTDFEQPVFDENKHYFWPIPLSDISKNPNLGQNQGW